MKIFFNLLLLVSVLFFIVSCASHVEQAENEIAETSVGNKLVIDYQRRRL